MLAALFVLVFISLAVGFAFNCLKAAQIFQAQVESYRDSTQFYGYAYGLVSSVGIALATLPWFLVLDMHRGTSWWIVVSCGFFVLFVPFVIGSSTVGRQKVLQLNAKITTCKTRA